MNKLYKFKELSNESQDRAVKEYLKGWLVTHPNDQLDYDESLQTLTSDLTDDRYTVEGVLQDEQFEIKYECYNCDHNWTEIYSCACDSQCGECGVKNVTTSSYKGV